MTDIGLRATAVRGATPPLIVAFFVTFLFPSTFAFFLGGLHLTPQKLFLLLVTLPAAALFLSTVRLRIYDWLFLGYVVWLSVATLKNYGGAGLTLFGTYVMTNVGTYALVQIAVRRVGDVERAAWLYFWLVVALGLLAIPEAVLKIRFLPDFATMITGHVREVWQNDERLGLLRAATVFSHQILHGVFCAPILAYVWYLARPGLGQLAAVAMVSLATFLALSSGPMIALIFQLGLILVERRTRHIQHRLRIVLILAALLYVALSIASDRGPVKLFLSYLTLNPSTAYYRLLIWDNAIDDVMRGPILGIRPETWTRPSWMTDSIDNFWLVQTLRAGIPGVALLLGSILCVLIALFRRTDAELGPKLGGLRRAAAYALIGLVFCGSAVHFFDKAEPVFVFFLGLAAALARLMEEDRARPPHPPPGASPAAAARPAAPPRRRTVL